MSLCYSLLEGRIIIDYFFLTINTLISCGANIALKNNFNENGYTFIHTYLTGNKLTIQHMREFIKLIMHISKRNAHFDYINKRSLSINGINTIFTALLFGKDVTIPLLDFFFSNNDKEKLKIMLQLIDDCTDDIIKNSFKSLTFLIRKESVRID